MPLTIAQTLTAALARDGMFWLALAGLVLAVARLVRGYRASRGSTLTAAWAWALASLVALVSVMLLDWGASHVPGRSLRVAWFVAATATYSPTMAVLGAKRPQHRAWQWIVLSLWAILALPAIHAWLLSRGELDVSHVQWGFLGGLSAVCAVNWLPTRAWAWGLLAAAAQWLLLTSHLPGVDVAPSTARQAGVAVYCVAISLSPLAGRFGNGGCSAVSAPDQTSTQALDVEWRSFRDRFGAFWAARVLTRLNAAAGAHRWPVTLTWSGFAWHARPVAPDVVCSLARCFHSLLRRFAGPR